MQVDLGLIPGLGRSPGEGKGYSLCSPHKESDTTDRLSLFTFTSLKALTQTCSHILRSWGLGLLNPGIWMGQSQPTTMTK